MQSVLGWRNRLATSVVLDFLTVSLLFCSNPTRIPPRTSYSSHEHPTCPCKFAASYNSIRSVHSDKPCAISSTGLHNRWACRFNVRLRDRGRYVPIFQNHESGKTNCGGYAWKGVILP